MGNISRERKKHESDIEKQDVNYEKIIASITNQFVLLPIINKKKIGKKRKM